LGTCLRLCVKAWERERERDREHKNKIAILALQSSAFKKTKLSPYIYGREVKFEL
jgi:hypothetical protein